MADEKKGITVKIDAELHAEVKAYLEQHGMTMAEFVTQALTDELHPKMEIKEEKTVEKMRTLAFQVPEELFQRIKGYLQRNNMTQKDFVMGLIETELEREQIQLQAQAAQVAEEAALAMAEPDEELEDLEPQEIQEDPAEDMVEPEDIQPPEEVQSEQDPLKDMAWPEETADLDQNEDVGMVMGGM